MRMSQARLTPLPREAAGYRLDGESELRRLQHIVSLKAPGFSLDAIGASPDDLCVQGGRHIAGRVDDLPGDKYAGSG